MKSPNNPINNWVIVLIVCATLGLAPFTPEPHVWGKLRWVLGGAEGMALVDYADLLMHGIPWLLLIRLIVLRMSSLFSTTNPQKDGASDA